MPGHPPVIFLRGVRIEIKPEARTGNVSESLLPYFHGCIEPVHQASVCVSEGMEPAAPNPKGCEQRMQLVLHD